jgi:hypothetical protein
MRYLIENIAVLRKMDALIRNKSTGTAEKFAARMNVSKSTLYVYLDVLKEFINDPDIEIIYNSRLKSYEYSKDGYFHFVAEWRKTTPANPRQNIEFTYILKPSSPDKEG